MLVEARSLDAGAADETGAILLRFDEPVLPGRGAIRLMGGEEVIKVSVRDPAQVAIDGSTVRVDPTRPLMPGTTYEVEIPGKAFRDLAGNGFGGSREGLAVTLTTAQPTSEATWTLMVYMAADNDLEPFALRDLAEMERVELPSSVNLVALVDRSPWYVAGAGDFVDTRRGPVRPDGDRSTVGAELASIGERDTGDPDTLTGFIDWAAATFPAEHYGLVVWNHGAGLGGVAWDDSSAGDRLTLAETRAAIEGAALGRLDLIGFDACLMALVEQASELTGLADVMVASQDLEPGDGWAYDRILRELARDPDLTSAALARTIVDTYAGRYAGKDGITLSAVDLDGVPALEAALADLALTIGATPDTAGLRALAGAVEAAHRFPDDLGYPYRDLGGFLDAVSGEIDDSAVADAARTARQALDAVVLAEAGTVEGASGLSVHLPGADDAPWRGYDARHFSFVERVPWDGLVDQLVAVG